VGPPGPARVAPPEPPALPTLLVLAFVTGVIDATSFLALGGVFSAMMTGNVVFLGLGLSGGAHTSVTGPLLAIAAYVTASAFAALLARRLAGPVFGTRTANAVEIGLLAAACVVAAAPTLDATGPSGYATLVLLAAAMGWRTTNVRALGSVNVPTAVLNLTLLAGPGSPGAGLAGAADVRPRVLALACFLGGAVTGGLLLRIDAWVPLAVAAVVSLLVGLALSRARGAPGAATRTARRRATGPA
jgi:uncharacterized membrane protein YoaK (UPF0700 family)